MVKLETKVKIAKTIQPVCEDIGFFFWGLFTCANFEGADKGYKLVKKIFNNYYNKLYGGEQLSLDF